MLISCCLHGPVLLIVLGLTATNMFPMVLLRGEDYVGRVPSRRPSHSASTSGSNPPWRTWQIALATPAHSAVGVVAAWPGLHTSIPSNPSQRPRSLRGSRALEVKLNRSLTGLSASLLLKLYSFTQLHTRLL